MPANIGNPMPTACLCRIKKKAIQIMTTQAAFQHWWTEDELQIAFEFARFPASHQNLHWALNCSKFECLAQPDAPDLYRIASKRQEAQRQRRARTRRTLENLKASTTISNT